MLNEKADKKLESNPLVSDKSRSLADKKRREIKVKKDFMKVIDEDQHLSKLFWSQKNAESNTLVGQLRDDLLNELLQLVEVVLV